MRRGPKPAKSKVESKPPVARKSAKSDDDRVRELEKRLAEALEQQTATAEILRVISRSPTDVQPVFDTIVRSAVRLCSARFANVFRLEGEVVHLAAHHNVPLEALEHFRRTFPQPLSHGGTLTAQAMRHGTVVHVPDIELQSDVAASVRSLSRSAGYRSALAVPIQRSGIVVGAIGVGRSDATGAPWPFSGKEVALLQTFADQAVIAIENVRLFKELEARNCDLTEALERQTATAEILSVISSSPTGVQPTFDAIARSAALLCRADLSGVHRFDGELIHFAAQYGRTAEEIEAVRQAFPQRPSRASATARCILSAAVVQIADHHDDPDIVDSLRMFRTVLAVPMLREGRPVGSISVARRVVEPFTEDQVELLKTFADQAVIAIENVRLFTELESRNKQLTEALEQQTATSEILRVISQSPTTVEPVFGAIVRSAAALCHAPDVIILVADGDSLRFGASVGPVAASVQQSQLIRGRSLSLTRGSVSGRAVIDRRTVHIHDVSAMPDDEFPEGKRIQQEYGGRGTTLAVPLLRDNVSLGVITLLRNEVRPFTDQQVALLETFADQAVIAIENVRLFTELEEKNRALTEAHAQVTEALDQQTATTDILRVIPQSPTDVQPVFDMIAQSAARLCEAQYCFVYRFEGQLLHFVAHHGLTAEVLEISRSAYPAPPGRRSVAARAVLERSVVQIPDVNADPDYALGAMAAAGGYRSAAAVPILRDGLPIGSIAVTRAQAGLLPDRQIDLLKTFADQAVIAIENVRLFKELEARTQDLTRSVGELQALGEVGQAISSTLDLRTVLSTIVARATQLAGTDAGVIYEYDEQREVFVPRATEHLEAEIVETMLATPVRKGEGATGRLAEIQEPIQVPDILATPAESRVRGALVRAGYRALLAVPLVREDHLLGGLTVIRKATGAFAPEVIELLRTFATQSALAIQNARLFVEIEDKSRQLEVASQHKSEFLANMSHELRTPLNAIIGFSEVLTERMFGDLNEKQEEYLKTISSSGTHLLSLINDILDLSKIEAGRMELELTDFDLPTALDNALTLVRERAGRRGITLQATIDERLGVVRADERKIRQVVLNLLSNAIKFTPEGGRIEIQAVPGNGLVEVSISDTGVGIAPEDQEAVFEEFRQVGTSAAKQEGTGLGLALCRKFIELHGGGIRVQSEVSVGSTFTFTIPVRCGE